MLNIAHPAPEGPGPLTIAAVPSSVVRGVSFDALGMPKTVAAAKSMSRSMIETALTKAVAELHHEPVTAVSATTPIDSIEIVFAMGRFYRHLGGRKQPNLSKIHRDNWSTIEGAADVLFHVTEDMR